MNRRIENQTRRLGSFRRRIFRWIQTSGIAVRFSGALFFAFALSFATTTHAVNDTVTVTSRILSGRGAIVPSEPLTVEIGTPVTLTYLPEPGFRYAGVSGCGGIQRVTFDTVTTVPVTSNCRVDFHFERIEYRIDPNVTGNGTIFPSVQQWVPSGETTTFTVTPAVGNTLRDVSGSCGGTLSGDVYVVNAMTQNCTVIANFVALPTMYTVTVDVGPFGNVSPLFPQTVSPGTRAVYTLAPNADYRAAVSGTCGGSLVGDTYTTDPIAGDCNVNVLFWPKHPAKPNDLNGDGKSDLILRNLDGRNSALLMNGTTVATRTPLSLPGNKAIVSKTGDFNGDGKADLITYDPDVGYRVVLMNGVTPTGSAPLPLTGAESVVAVADFDGDGKSDLLVQARVADGTPVGNALVTMNGTQGVYRYLSNVPRDYAAAYVADLNGDGTPDVIYSHWLTGEVAVALVRNGDAEPAVPVNIGGSGWYITHVGDLDGDGKADLIVKNRIDGRVALYLMNGTAIKASATIIAANSGWRVTHVGDFDGDGRSDLLLEHAQGRTYMMLMDGLHTASAGPISPSGSGWSVKQLADFNGDGKMDLVFQNTNGAIDVWLVNGTTLLRKASIEAAGTGWEATPPAAPR
jgi:FG-GAP-like repeat/Divergent InlB B-repeat domain